MLISRPQSSFRRVARLLAVLMLCLMLVPYHAFAVSLDEAKSKGLVGEEPSGYLGVVAASPDVSQLVQDINAKRRQKYQQIAEQNHTAVSAVEALAGQKAIESTPSGQLVKSTAGSWIKK